MDGKKLLVLSDTHGNIPALKAVLDWAKNQTPPNGTISAAVFLGDGVSDLRRTVDAAGFFCDWKMVQGNNDYGFSIPESAIFDFEDHRFFMCHGHRYAVYNGYNALVAAALNMEAEAVFFGHTHVPSCKREKGLLLINPGSVGRPRSRLGATFAVIDCVPGKPPEAVFWGVGSRGEIRKVKLIPF